MAIANSSLKLLAMAKCLVYSVHETLGRTRDGTARLPGASDDHPLRGGFRMGLKEGDGEDGQFHHTLKLWMFALNRLSIASEAPEYNDMALELAKSIRPNVFTDSPTRTPTLAWKISSDMQMTLVPSPGHLDAMTGLNVFKLIQQTAKLRFSIRRKG